MPIQYSILVNNARLDAVESQIGTAAVLKIRSGAPPATCATADAGSVRVASTVPSDWMSAAAAGVKAKLGTWQDTSADAAGTAAHFRIYDSAGTTVGMQGTVTATGGGGDLQVDNVVFAAGQSFTITAFSITAANT